jgi:hypothetical protein
MPKAHASWTVLRHGPLERLDDRLWRVEGTLRGMAIKRVMAIAQRSDGGLVVHGAIAVDDATRAAIEALGPIAAIVVPNGYHRLDAPAFHARYPEAKVWCAPGSRRRVEQVVPVDATYDALPPDPAVTIETAPGTGDREGAMIVRGAGGTSVVLNDLVFNMPHLAGWPGFLLRRVTGSSGGPRISRLSRLALIADKRAARAYLERLAAIPDLRRVLVAHHETIEGDVAGTLRRVAATL